MEGNGNSKRLAEEIGAALEAKLARPMFLRVTRDDRGQIEVAQVQFLSTKDFADITRLDPRTIRDWATSKECPLTFYKPPGSNRLLVDLEEAVAFIRSGALDNETFRP